MLPVAVNTSTGMPRVLAIVVVWYANVSFTRSRLSWEIQLMGKACSVPKRRCPWYLVMLHRHGHSAQPQTAPLRQNDPMKRQAVSKATAWSRSQAKAAKVEMLRWRHHKFTNVRREQASEHTIVLQCSVGEAAMLPAFNDTRAEQGVPQACASESWPASPSSGEQTQP